jgi:5-hydroxyisourate hydrolase
LANEYVKYPYSGYFHRQACAGVAVNLLRGGQSIASGITDENGRIASLAPGKLAAGRYRLVAETGDWFTRRPRDAVSVRAD